MLPNSRAMSLLKPAGLSQQDAAIKWPDPTPEMLETRAFNAIWERIKTWDINVPEIDGQGMYSGVTGNHVRAILDALGPCISDFGTARQGK